MKTPPRFWRGVLGHVVPRQDRAVLLDEMDRLYATREQASGAQGAARWYRSEVLQFVRRWPLEWSTGVARQVVSELGGLGRLTRQTVRGLVRAPAFAAVSITTLALGLGASAVIVGIVDRALLRPLPYAEPDQLVAVLDGWGASLGTIEILQNEMTTVEALGGARNAEGMTLEAGFGPAQRITVASVSPEYLEALRVAPQVGRTFTRDESQPGRDKVVLLGHDFWQTHFGGSPNAVSQSLMLDGESHAVIGVLPKGFDLPTARNEIWKPVVMDPTNPGEHWGAGNHALIARMAPGASPERVRGELLRVQDLVRNANPLWTPNVGFWDEAKVTPLQEARGGAVRTPLLVLLGAVGLVMLVVCANVANLFVSRGLSRTRESAVRVALGAGGGRLAREQLFEVVLVSAIGLGLGLTLAALGLRLLHPYLPSQLPGIDQSGLDLRVVLMTSAVGLVAAIAAGAIPAWRTARQAPGQLLRESGRGRSASRERRRVTRWLVAAQLAVSVVLVTSAGLLTRTLFELNQVDPGFEIDGRVTAELHLPPGLPEDPAARSTYFQELETQLESHGSLERVAFASTIPFGAESEYIAVAIDGVTTDPNNLPVVPHHRVSTGFFEVTGIPLRQGRMFDKSDQPETPLVAIVDQAFVDRFYAGQSPIGRVVRYPWRGAPPIEVVGVVASISHGDLASESEPTVWVPLAQMGFGVLGNAVTVARASGETDAALNAITQRIHGVDKRIAVSDMATYRQLVTESMAPTRLMTMLLLIFAGTTLVLGCVGVYGVAAFSVRERLKEIGVRMALGAPVSGIRAGVLKDGLFLTMPGAVLGMLLAIPAAHALESTLYGITPTDPLAFGLAPAVLALAAMAALYFPARRATQVDPAVVLRDD